jgi:hypothetical protein
MFDSFPEPSLLAKKNMERHIIQGKRIEKQFALIANQVAGRAFETHTMSE